MPPALGEVRNGSESRRLAYLSRNDGSPPRRLGPSGSLPGAIRVPPTARRQALSKTPLKPRLVGCCWFGKSSEPCRDFTGVYPDPLLEQNPTP